MAGAARAMLMAISAVVLIHPLRAAPAQQSTNGGAQTGEGARYVGFDRNLYPGEEALPTLRKHFSYTGYWLNLPPGEQTNSWVGKRPGLRAAGFGFLVLWNGRLDAELVKARRRGGTPVTQAAAALGTADGLAAAAAARREGFPANTVLFLDQEEGGRMLPEQAAYLLHWTEAVAAHGYSPGVYASGQPVEEGPAAGGGRVTITTAQDITEQVRSGHLHRVALWVAQDSCPPSNGCALAAPPLTRSGTPGALVWQYAQSPRRPEITRSCAKTYAADGSCLAPELPALFLDLNVSSSADPSRGR